MNRRNRQLTETEAIQLLLDAGAVPREPYPGNQNVPWRCECVLCHCEITPRLGSIVSGSRACRYCFGSRPCSPLSDTPAQVYIIHNLRHRAVKVGATAAYRNRMKNFPRWKVAAVLNTATGQEAESIEREILTCWREELHLPEKLHRGDLPNKGHTETADESGLEAALLIFLEHGWKGFSPETD